MLKLAIFCLVGFQALLFPLSIQAQTEYPPYIVELVKGPLQPFLDPIKGHFRLKAEASGENGTSLILEILTPQRKPQEARRVYSRYRIAFAEQIASAAMPTLAVHRFQDKNGEYIHPAITGEVTIRIENGQIRKGQDLPGILRSLFRADQTLHPLFKNPYLPDRGQRLTLPQTQAIVGQEINGTKIPGLIDFYKEHLASAQAKPLQAALILPTGIGKTVLALRYLQFVEVLSKQKPLVIFVVENKQILDDVHQKFLGFYESKQIARLYGEGTQSILTPDISAVLATRTTAHTRLDELIRFAKSQGQPVILFRDEAHRTGKEGGQFARINQRFMTDMGLRDQVIDLTATPWHEERPDMIRDYEGRVATTFVSPEEYKQFVSGEKVSIVSRVQLLRAIFSGWLAPLSSMSFITQDTESNTQQVSFRRSLQQEQEGLAKKLGIPSEELFTVNFETLSEEQVQGLRKYIRDVHEPIIRALYQDILNQQLRDQSGKVAEYDRGLIFVPTILHAEIYKEILNQLARSQNMSFRAIHSKMNGPGRGTVGENIDWLNDLDRSSTRTNKFLINVAMAREGVDIPGVNRLLYVTTTDSIKVLIQAFGRSTRLNPLKTGIRLTDFGGSYLEFFKEIPANLLARLFSSKDSKSATDTSEAQRSSIRHNQKEISVKELVSLEVEDPMEKLVEVISQDESKLADPIEARKLEVFDSRPLTEIEKYSWSIPERIQNQTDVQAIVDVLRKNSPTELNEARKNLRGYWMQLSLPWYYFYKDYDPENLEKKMNRINLNITLSEQTELRLVHQALQSDLRPYLLDGFPMNDYLVDPRNYATIAAYSEFMNLMGTAEGRSKLAKSRGIELILQSLMVDPKSQFEGKEWLANPDWVHRDLALDSIFERHNESTSGRIGPALAGTPLGDGYLRYQIPALRAGLILAQHTHSTLTTDIDAFFSEPDLKDSKLLELPYTSGHKGRGFLEGDTPSSRSPRVKSSESGFKVFGGVRPAGGFSDFAYTNGPELLEIETILRFQDLLIKVFAEKGEGETRASYRTELLETFTKYMLPATHLEISQGISLGVSVADAARSFGATSSSQTIGDNAPVLFEAFHKNNSPFAPQFLDSPAASPSGTVWLNLMRKLAYGSTLDKSTQTIADKSLQTLFSIDYGFEITEEQRILENASWLLSPMDEFLKEIKPKTTFYSLLYSSYDNARNPGGKRTYMMLPLVLGYEKFDVIDFQVGGYGRALAVDLPRMVDHFKNRFKDQLRELGWNKAFPGKFLDPMLPPDSSGVTAGRIQWMKIVNFLTMYELAKKLGYQDTFLKANGPRPQSVVASARAEKEKHNSRRSQEGEAARTRSNTSTVSRASNERSPLYADMESSFEWSFPRPIPQNEIQKVVSTMANPGMNVFSYELLELLKAYWRPLSLPWYYQIHDITLDSSKIDLRGRLATVFSQQDMGERDIYLQMETVRPLIENGQTRVYQGINSDITEFIPQDILDKRYLFENKELWPKIEAFILFQSLLATESGRAALASARGIERALLNHLTLYPTHGAMVPEWAENPRWIQHNPRFADEVQEIGKQNGFRIKDFSTALRGLPVDVNGRRAEFPYWRTGLVATQQSDRSLKTALNAQLLEPEIGSSKIFLPKEFRAGSPGGNFFFQIFLQNQPYSWMSLTSDGNPFSLHRKLTPLVSPIFEIERDLWVQDMAIKIGRSQGVDALEKFKGIISETTLRKVAPQDQMGRADIFTLSGLLDSLPKVIEGIFSGELTAMDQIRVIEEVRKNETKFPEKVGDFQSSRELGEIYFESYRRLFGTNGTWMENLKDSSDLKPLVEILAAVQSTADFPERDRVDANKQWLLMPADPYLKEIGLSEGQLDILFKHYELTSKVIGRRMFMLLPAVYYSEFVHYESTRLVDRTKSIQDMARDFKSRFASELESLKIETAFGFDAKKIAEDTRIYETESSNQIKRSFSTHPRSIARLQYEDLSMPDRVNSYDVDSHRLQWMEIVDYLTMEVITQKFGVYGILDNPTVGREILENARAGIPRTVRQAHTAVDSLLKSPTRGGLRCSQVFGE